MEQDIIILSDCFITLSITDLEGPKVSMKIPTEYMHVDIPFLAISMFRIKILGNIHL